MTTALIINCLLIMFARIVDVSLGTLRSVSVIYGRRRLAWFFGFFEVLIWVLVVSRVLGLVQQHPVYGVFYALGFATGNFIGITIEQALAFGDRAVRIFTRLGQEMADALRDEEFAVTEFDGRGRDGPIMLLYVQTRRKLVPRLLRRAREIDPSCYYIIEDIRAANTATLSNQSPSLWRGVDAKR